MTPSVARHPAAVLESIAKWLDDKDRATAGINAFLALASKSTGAALLCDRADSATGQAGFRDRLIYWFQRAAAESDTSYQATISVYQAWQKLSNDNVISSRIAIPVLAPEAASLEADTPGAPFPTPEAPAWPAPQATEGRAPRPRDSPSPCARRALMMRWQGNTSSSCGR
jgi:hypothetical protein